MSKNVTYENMNEEYATRLIMRPNECWNSLKGPGRVFSCGFDLYGICGRRLPNSLMKLYVSNHFLPFSNGPRRSLICVGM